MRLVAVDIGGTHARFAIAAIASGGGVTISDMVKLKTADHASFASAWQHYAAHIGQPLPSAAAFAVAGPVNTGVFTFTNNSWVIDRGALCDRLGIAQHIFVNDFEAVGHAVARGGDEHLRHLAGPAGPLPERGTISVLGPGTGLGVAHVWRDSHDYRVTATEGGHIDFAPLDQFEDALLARLRARHRRVSVERIVSGPGLIDVYETLAGIEQAVVDRIDDATLWQRAIDASDVLAVAALDRFCLTLGSVAGDLALAQGANGVVIGGGLGLRLQHVLPTSGFAARFTRKGRFEAMMARLPVKLITNPEPGLHGAAIAFAHAFAT